MSGCASQGLRRERVWVPGRDFVRVCDLQVPLENEVWSRLTLTFDYQCLAWEHLLKPFANIAVRSRDH